MKTWQEGSLVSSFFKIARLNGSVAIKRVQTESRLKKKDIEHALSSLTNRVINYSDGTYQVKAEKAIAVLNKRNIFNVNDVSSDYMTIVEVIR